MGAVLQGQLRQRIQEKFLCITIPVTPVPHNLSLSTFPSDLMRSWKPVMGSWWLAVI